MYKIVIVEDDVNIREELCSFLQKYGYEITAPTDFQNIIDIIQKESANLIILDINLPAFDGYYICRELRKTSEVPIIIVTSRDSELDELMSMNIGADDFITKPYNTQILLARINSILKRSYGNFQEVIVHNGISLNLSNASLSFENNTIELTKNELKILAFLLKNKGNIVSRDSLMEYLWSSDYFVDDSTLTVNITRLRKKIEDIGIENLIQTKRGLGYIIL